MGCISNINIANFGKVLTIILFTIKCTHELSCVDENGDSVDWFIVYKVPKLETSSLETLKSGFGYTFITDKSVESLDWTLSKKTIDKKDSILGSTVGPLLKQMLSNSKSLSFVVYNDQSPDAKSSSGAHSKGIFAIDNNGGFWLTHSVPRFPSLSGLYKFPENAKHNGQTVLCISIASKDSKSADNIAVQMLYMKPNMYGISISDDLKSTAKHFIDLEKKKWIKKGVQSQLPITSKNGIIFSSFAKSNKFSQDLYSGLIAVNLKQDLLVQSWRNGAGDKLDSNCSVKYKVQNVDKIRLVDVNRNDGMDWSSTEDHSKWVITSDTKKDQFTCISDINRMKSQFKRGGGSLCIKSDKVWTIFKKTVESIEGCKIKRPQKFSTNI